MLERLILEEDQFDVHDILPNTVPDPASLTLESDYDCPVGQVVMAPDCGEPFLKKIFYIQERHPFVFHVSYSTLFHF